MSAELVIGRGLISAIWEAKSHYSKVKGLHAEFHSRAGKILNLAVSGKKNDALKLLNDANGEYMSIK